MIGFAVVLVCALTAPAAAQDHVTLTGQVRDASGAVLDGAVVEVRLPDGTTIESATGSDGRYRLAVARGARVEVRVGHAGFQEERVELAAHAETVRDFVLRLAPFSDMAVVTASRVPEALSATTGSVTVITAEQIRAMGASQVADVLRHVPGVSVEANGREGAVASLFARGAESDYNLVLIDGVRVNANGGQFDFSRVGTHEIERIEVVRGAQSALYGSDAIGSVVQILTRRADVGDAPQVAIDAEAGSFETRGGDLSVFGGIGRRADYAGGVSHRATAGAFADALREDDRFDETVAYGNLGASVASGTTLRAGGRYARARGRAPGPIAYGARDTGTLANTRDLSWHGTAMHVAAGITHTATVSYVRSQRMSGDDVADPAYTVYAVLAGRPGARFPDSPRLVRLLEPRAFNAIRAGAQPLGEGQFLAWTPFGVADFPFTSATDLQRPTVRYIANASWAGGQVASGGYEFERERDPLSDFETHNHAYFAQQQFTLRDRWFATVGARLDRHSRYGTELSPKLSAGGFLVPFRPGALSSFKVFGNIGRGIKAPLFGELFGSPFSDGNPNLHQERARTMDAGAEVTLDAQRWRIRAAYFRNDFRDQVAFRSSGPGPDGVPDFVNIDGSRARGWELEASLQRPYRGLTAGGSYSLVDTEVVAFVSTSEQFQPGQPLLRRPRHSGLLHAQYVAGRAAAHLHVRVIGQRHDAAFLGLMAVPAPGSPVAAPRPVDVTVNPGYTVVSAGADYRLGPDVTAFVRVENLTDAAYEGALGYPGLPRSIVAGGRVTIRLR